LYPAEKNRNLDKFGNHYPDKGEEQHLSVEIMIDLNSIYFLPDWVVHPTVLDRFDYDCLYSRGAEQGRGEIEVRCVRCEAPKPPITNNNDKYDNNDGKRPDDNLCDGVEDTNQNGRIDGDNGDGIKGSTEAWDETSPTLSDSDNDGFRDDLEWENDMDPRTQDSDHDGLLDQEEDIDKDFTLDSDETDPTLFDTDGDGLSDKTEIDGWVISIIKESTGEEDRHYNVTSNPRLINSDTDKLTDYQEFQNCTDPTKADTDGDGKDDYVELTYDLGSSPTGIDGVPPTITDFSSDYEFKTYTSGPWYDIKITMEYVVNVYISASDIFGLDWVNVHLDGVDDFIYYCSGEESINNKEFEFTLDVAQAARSLFGSIDVNITAMDVNGNLGFKEEEIPSFAEQMFDGLLGELKRFANFVGELFSTMYNWVLKSARIVYNNIIEPIISTVYSYISNIYKSFDKLILCIVDIVIYKKDISFEDILYKVIDFIYSIIGPFIDLMGGMIDVLQNVMNFLLKFKNIIENTIRDAIEEILSTFLNLFGDVETPEILIDFVYYTMQGQFIDFVGKLITPGIGFLCDFISDQFSSFSFDKPYSEVTKAETYDPPEDGTGFPPIVDGDDDEPAFGQKIKP